MIKAIDYGVYGLKRATLSAQLDYGYVIFFCKRANIRPFENFAGQFKLLLLLLLPDPFQGMGAWRKTMEPGNSPGSGPEVVKRQRVAKERAAQRVRSWRVQNEIRGVLKRVSAGAARRILDSANPRETRT